MESSGQTEAELRAPAPTQRSHSVPVGGDGLAQPVADAGPREPVDQQGLHQRPGGRGSGTRGRGGRAQRITGGCEGGAEAGRLR
jgi:hypothetical protein